MVNTLVSIVSTLTSLSFGALDLITRYTIQIEWYWILIENELHKNNMDRSPLIPLSYHHNVIMEGGRGAQTPKYQFIKMPWNSELQPCQDILIDNEIPVLVHSYNIYKGSVQEFLWFG